MQIRCQKGGDFVSVSKYIIVQCTSHNSTKIKHTYNKTDNINN